MVPLSKFKPTINQHEYFDKKEDSALYFYLQQQGKCTNVDNSRII